MSGDGRQGQSDWVLLPWDTEPMQWEAPALGHTEPGLSAAPTGHGTHGVGSAGFGSHRARPECCSHGTQNPWSGKRRLWVTQSQAWAPALSQSCDPGQVYLVFCFLSWKSLTDEMKCCVRLNFPSRTIVVWWPVSPHHMGTWGVLTAITYLKSWNSLLERNGECAGSVLQGFWQVRSLSAPSPCHLLYTCGFSSPILRSRPVQMTVHIFGCQAWFAGYLSSLARDWTHSPLAVRVPSLNHWMARGFSDDFLF